MEQESLFSASGQGGATPLANRVRPRELAEFFGQDQLVGTGKVLSELIEQDRLPSLILWGPPGVGKTTLAEIIAQKTKAKFITFSAVNSSIKDIKQVMEAATANHQFGERTVVFIDEIHRFNKAQQDAFLPYVERGEIILIGATTENPSFELNAALLSRCKVFVLRALDKGALVKILHRALHHPNGFADLEITVEDGVLEAIANFANGDARMALNTLEMAVLNGQRNGHQVKLTNADLTQLTSTHSLRYDRAGDEHYDLISALHKSIRNSDVDAAVYWCSRMLAGGEEPLYIARRLVRFAAEDVGLADTNALQVATNTFQACQFLGMPECDVHLTECVIYLAAAPKSNAVYAARNRAKKIIKQTGNLPVPLQIRNAPTKLMKELDYGKGYQYAHDSSDRLTTMQTMPDEISGAKLYRPTDQGNEAWVKQRLAAIAAWHRQHDNPREGGK